MLRRATTPRAAKDHVCASNNISCPLLTEHRYHNKPISNSAGQMPRKRRTSSPSHLGRPRRAQAPAGVTLPTLAMWQPIAYGSDRRRDCLARWELRAPCANWNLINLIYSGSAKVPNSFQLVATWFSKLPPKSSPALVATPFRPALTPKSS